MGEIDSRTRVSAYVDSVMDGSAVSCRMVRLAVERWKRDLDGGEYYADWDLLDKFCRFSSEFRHYKGPCSGKTFILEDWQMFIAANCIALKSKDTGRRKYRLADVYVPRKNGKTMFAAVMALWFLLLDGEGGPEVYTAALDKDQARLSYDAAATLVKNSIFAPLVNIKPSRAVMEGRKNNGVCKPLSRDTKNKDGLNIHAAICDERHAWPNTEMLDVIKTGMGARSQPFLLSISTAGTDISNPYFADIEAYKEELSGVRPIENDHFFMLYCPDDGDSWEDEAVWRKVNPNLGVSLSLEYMRSTFTEAKLRGGTYEIAFKTKNLNQWVDAPDVWIDDGYVKECNAPLDESLLLGEECYVGIDLASKTDITATAFYFPKHNAVKYMFILPEDKIKKNEDRVDYRLWQQQGWLTVSPGAVLNEDWFIDTLLKELDKYNIRAICYDPWGMWNILPKFGRYQNVLMEYRQDIRYMSVPTKWLASAVLQKEMNFLYNPVIRWMFKNVVVYIDPNANVKLDKGRSRNKIDGVVATVDAIGGYLNTTAKAEKSVYKDHELRIIDFQL